MTRVSKQLSIFEQTTTSDARDEHTLMLFFDGAARNNPGPAGIGIVIKRGNVILLKRGFFIGERTNNQAEYLALIVGVLIAREQVVNNELLHIFSDSQLLIQQMKGLYRVKNPGLQHLSRVAHMLTSPLNVHFEHILRLENKEADAAANHGIETQTVVPDRYRQMLHEYHIVL